MARQGVGAARIGTRNEVPSRHVPSPNPRTAMTRTAPPTRGLPPVQSGQRDMVAATGRPTVPAAREETVELGPVLGVGGAARA